MTKRERIKDMLGYVKEHIENVQYGYDGMEDYSYIIKYKDGEIVYITGYDIPGKFCRNVSKIEYIVASDPEDSYDSNGKSWLNDFVVNDGYTDWSLEAWDGYVDQILYKDNQD